MNNDYKQMSLRELRVHVLANRQDSVAWDEFVSRPRPNATFVPAGASPEEMGRILEKAISKQKPEQ